MRARYTFLTVYAWSFARTARLPPLNIVCKGTSATAVPLNVQPAVNVTGSDSPRSTCMEVRWAQRTSPHLVLGVLYFPPKAGGATYNQDIL